MTGIRIVAVGLAMFLYLRSPIDFIPDRIGALGLLDDLAVLLTFLWWAYRQVTQQHSPSPNTNPSSTSWDPYAVLAVGRDASPEEISHAYREQMKLYHPDRVADLGPELQQLAHRKATDIQRAYQELRH